MIAYLVIAIYQISLQTASMVLL